MSGTAQSTSPLKAVKDLYEAFDAHDVEAVFGCFAEDVEITQSDELPWGGTYRGLEEAASFFMSLTSQINTRVSVDRFITAGDTVVETGRTSGKAVATGREFSISETHVFKVRDGKIVRMEAYVDNSAMLAAISPRD